MSTTNIGLPKIRLAFEQAAKDIFTRAKKGTVGVVVKDTKAAGVYTVRDETDIPSQLGETNRAYALRALIGSDLGKPNSMLLIVYDGTGDEGQTALKAALGGLTGQEVDYLAAPHDATEAELTAVKDFVLAYRKRNPTLAAVLPKVAADDRGIINYTSEAAVGAETFTPAQYCSRIAGVFAGVPTTASATNLTLSEVTAVKALAAAEQTEEEAQSAAIGRGELILTCDGIRCKIARAVNSYVSLKADETTAMCKVKITEAEGLVSYRTGQVIDQEWLGRVVNSYDNRCLLIVELQLMFQSLEQQGLFLPGTTGAEIDIQAQRTYMEDNGVNCAEMTDQEIKQYEDLGEHVFWRAYGKFADVMEDFDGRFVRGGQALDSGESA